MLLRLKLLRSSFHRICMALRNVPTIELLNQKRQFGSANLVGATTVNVTFGTNFNVVPKVFVTPQTDVTKRWWVSAKSTTGFTISLTGSDTDTFDWLAIESL